MQEYSRNNSKGGETTPFCFINKTALKFVAVYTTGVENPNRIDH